MLLKSILGMILRQVLGGGEVQRYIIIYGKLPVSSTGLWVFWYLPGFHNQIIFAIFKKMYKFTIF